MAFVPGSKGRTGWGCGDGPVVGAQTTFRPAPCGEDGEGDNWQEGKRDANESGDEGKTARECPKVSLHGSGWLMGLAAFYALYRQIW